MKKCFGASLTIALAAAAALPAIAADLPDVKISDSNPVPACATPGRLMAYVRSRNPKVDDRFDGVATEYMRHGEELGLRWDMAFFQMILETGALSYTGDVRADQNNFAGLGASGGGQHGERFADISSGVKAHLQHLLMYAGDHIDDPVAERTRKVQEWGVLTDWQKALKGPITFTILAKEWAPGSRGYVRDITHISEGFYGNLCNAPDPRPELVQEARKGRQSMPETQVAETAPDAVAVGADKATSAEIANRAIEEARKEAAPRASLGAGMLGNVAEAAKPAASQEADSPGAQPAVTLINPSAPEEGFPEATGPEAVTQDTANAAAITPAAANAAGASDTAKAATVNADAASPGAEQANPQKKADSSKGADAAKSAAIQTASVAGAATQLQLPPTSKATAKCKVWTASYGGQRAILIKATAESTVNYTVLDVNEAGEKREVDAYIAAYAKGGQRIGDFTSQTKALDKAFELCPEG